MTANTLRAIIVGGGPVGLTAAHALKQAGIDFVMLEQRSDIVIKTGSNLVLRPMGLKALEQFELIDALNAVSSPLGRIDRLDHAGRNIGDSTWYIEMEKMIGLAPRVISRHDLTRVLYEQLGAESQSKLLPNKKLTSIESSPDGVLATCADGTTYSGSFVIGADGAHSMVRRLMRTLALKEGSTEVNEEKPFLTTYRAMWVRFPKASILPGTTCETHGRDLATQLFAGEDSAVIAVYDRLSEPTRERSRYTSEDQDALVARWAHLPVTADLSMTLGDVFNSKLESGLTDLEEGVARYWSYNSRIVLVGDAAHKFTPSTGAGCNNGIVDIVAMVRELHAANQKKSSVASAFQAYQQARFADVTTARNYAAQATASATWTTAVHQFIDTWVLSIHALQKLMIRRAAASEVANQPILDSAHGAQHRAIAMAA